MLYTDGITEAENVAGDPYGQERRCEVVRAYWSHPCEVVKNVAEADVRCHIGEQEVNDDIPLVVMKRQSEKMGPWDRDWAGRVRRTPPSGKGG